MASEEKRKKDLKALIEGKIDEYGVTKRTLYSALGILGCLGLTIVMSITGMGFDPAVFLTWNYWTSMIVQFAIAIFSMITGEQIGDDTQRNKPDGQFRKELKKYQTERNRMDDGGYVDYFDLWLVHYREGKIERKIKKTLRNFGIKQDEVLDLDRSELHNLSHPWEKDWADTPYYEKYYDEKKGRSVTIFKSLTETQIEAIEKIMDGYVSVPEVPSSYFLTALKGTSADEWYNAAVSDKKKGAQLAFGYSYRIVSMSVISIVLNGLIPAPYDTPGAVALNIAIRIFVLITSVVWGIYLGFKVVNMDITFLSYKSLILKLCANECESGKFKPETIEEEAERELEQYNAEQEKAKKDVVEPEVVPIPKPDDTLLIGGGGNE